MFKTQPKSTFDPPRDDLAVHIQHLKYSFGVDDLSKQVLFDISLELPKGQIVILTGPSGSGKTTLLTLTGALRHLQSGSLRILGKELVGMSEGALVKVRRSIGFIFQAHNLFESLTASQNVEMAVELTGNFSSKREQAVAMLSALGLSDRVDYKPKSLSGGQKQRVAIARALVNHPKLILADEPTAALDKKSGRDVVNYLHTLSREEGCTVLMVTHDNRILDAADRIINLVDGRLESDSTINAFIQSKTKETLTEVSADMFIM
ncbi:MAG: ATP-binding cassette domain-containing protein [Cyanobacteria bacterium P01_C01_bin.118]